MNKIVMFHLKFKLITLLNQCYLFHYFTIYCLFEITRCLLTIMPKIILPTALNFYDFSLFIKVCLLALACVGGEIICICVYSAYQPIAAL